MVSGSIGGVWLYWWCLALLVVSGSIGGVWLY